MSFGIVQHRHGTAAEAAAANVVLYEGELAYEKDTKKFKIGDGTTAWNSLPYGGIKGDTGDASTVPGPPGNKGWSPIVGVVTDGQRRVLQVGDWTGGEGAKPSTINQFIGPTGIVSSAAAAVDVRGSEGPAGPSMVVNAAAQFGADPTGTNDSTAAIQAAADSVAPGGQIFLPRGRYKISTDGTGVTITNNHVVLVGEGKADTILFTDHASASMVTFGAGAWYCGMRDMACDNANAGGTAGRVTRTGGWAIDMGDTPYCFLDDVDVQWHLNSIRSAGHLATLSALNVRQFAQNGGVGILLEGSASANDKFLIDITMDNATWTAASSCIRVKQAASIRMSNMNLVHAGQVLDLFPDAGQVIPSIYAVNSFFDQGSVACLRVRGAGAVQRSAFVNSWFSGNPPANSPGAGVLLEAATTIQGLDFTSCHFLGNVIGIDAQGSNTTDCDWSVQGSRFAGNTTSAVRTTAGTKHRFNVVNNRMGQSAGFLPNNLAVDVGAGQYLSYQVVQNRGLDNNTIPGIRDAGTTIERFNKQVTQNMGALLPGILTAITADVAQPTGTGTTEQIVTQAKIPANAVSPGTVFRVLYKGLIGAVTGNPIIRVRIGTVGTIAGDTVIALATAGTGAANALVRAEITLTVRTAPTSGNGTIQPSSIGHINATAAQLLPAAASVNMTVPWFITVTQVTSAATGLLTARNAYIEVATA